MKKAIAVYGVNSVLGPVLVGIRLDEDAEALARQWELTVEKKETVGGSIRLIARDGDNRLLYLDEVPIL
ncbi:MAG: hypothetical protein QY311_01770 [Candidatus Paceibacterota bacterium]|nr:MAG: hypothetical protein QY311_01770 [Candidatus Paceibacterota bacterium]